MAKTPWAIRDAMVATVLVAANLAALRWLVTPSPVALIVLVVLLPANLLLFGLVRMGYRLARGERPRAFAVAAQALGWPATFLLGWASFSQVLGRGGEWLQRYFEVARVPTRFVLNTTGIARWANANANPASWGSLMVDAAFFLVALGVPLLVLTLVGAMLLAAIARRPRGGGDRSG